MDFLQFVVAICIAFAISATVANAQCENATAMGDCSDAEHQEFGCCTTDEALENCIRDRCGRCGSSDLTGWSSTCIEVNVTTFIDVHVSYNFGLPESIGGLTIYPAGTLATLNCSAGTPVINWAVTYANCECSGSWTTIIPPDCTGGSCSAPVSSMPCDQAHAECCGYGVGPGKCFWDGTKCIPIPPNDCPNPSAGLNVTLEFSTISRGGSAPYSPDTRIHFTCPNDYYLTPNVTTSTCNCSSSSHCHWDPIVSGSPSCTAGCWPVNNTIMDAAHCWVSYNPSVSNLADMYEYGTNATFTCDDSYYMDTGNLTANITCSKTNSWTQPLSFTCLHGCKPPTIGNGNASVDYGYSPINNLYINGSTSTYNCKSGFYLSSFPLTNSTCINGRWDKAPTCRQGCWFNDTMVNVTNGKTTFLAVRANQLYWWNDTANFTCDFGYYISSTKPANCSGGNWTNIPTCDPGCPPFVNLANGNISYSLQLQLFQFYPPNTLANFTCDENYYLNSTSFTATCNKNYWTAYYQCLPGCTKESVPEIANQFNPPQMNASLTANGLYPSNSTATYTCISTYNLNNVSYSKCVNGNWTDPPTCVEPSTALVVTKAILGMSCTFLIIALSVIIVINLIVRDFSIESCLHLNEEISLLLAHIILILFRDRVDLVVICPLASMFLQYFFTTSFIFQLIESIQSMYILTNVISRGGIHSSYPRIKNLVVGWAVAIVPTTIAAAWRYNYYPSFNSCWVNVGDTICGIITAPIAISFFATVVFTEAAAMGLYKQLPLADRQQIFVAHINQKNMFPLTTLSLLSWGVGMMASYNASAALFSVASIVNTTFGIAIIFCHFIGNPKLSAWFMKKFCKKIVEKKEREKQAKQERNKQPNKQEDSKLSNLARQRRNSPINDNILFTGRF